MTDKNAKIDYGDYLRLRRLLEIATALTLLAMTIKSIKNQNDGKSPLTPLFLRGDTNHG
jgi:hypothetical protein